MPNGITHSNGIGATSDVMYVVTLNIRLHGTNANTTHRHRRRAVSVSGGASADASAEECFVAPERRSWRVIHNPHTAVSPASKSYPTVHHWLCWLNRRCGSMNAG